MLDEFGKEYALVILDSPPLLGFAECLQMASAADGVLIVSRAGETKRRAVAEVIGVLRRLRSNIIGVVLNQMTYSPSPDGYGYYAYHEEGVCEVLQVCDVIAKRLDVVKAGLYDVASR